MPTIVHLPTNALEQINLWADRMHLSHAEFHTRALVLGAGAMASSLAFFPSLSPDLKKRASQAGDASVTPQMIEQIITGSATSSNDAPGSGTDLAIDLASDKQAEIDQAIKTSGMDPVKFCTLAFVTGARVLASTLARDSVFTPKVSDLVMRKEVTPEELMKTRRKKRPRKPAH